MNENFVPMDWPVFVGICLGWLALAFFFLAGRKVFFEPFKEPSDSE
jgi:hypothetical protein